MNLNILIETNKAPVAIVGAGYVGLPNALLFAQREYKVIAADINPRIVEWVNLVKLKF